MGQRGCDGLAKHAHIRITKNDRKRHANLAKRAKAKLARTKKNHPTIDLSGDIQIKSITDFKTRDEYNEWSQKMESFLDRSNWKYQFKKNKYGLSISKSEENKLIRKTKLAQEKAKKQLEYAEKLPFVMGGKAYGTVGDRIRQMPDAHELNIYIPPDFNFDAIQNQSQLRMKSDSIHKRANPDSIDKRMEDMRDNFMTILEKSHNSDADELIERLKNVPPKIFLEMYWQFEEFDFTLYRSDPDEKFVQEIRDRGTDDINQMIAYIDAYEKGNLTFDMMGFDR